MKKLICMLAAVMLLFTACGNRDANDDTNNGVVQDGDGIIEDNRNNDSVMDDMADGANDVVDGAADAVDDAANGVENAVDDMTDSNKTDNNKNNSNNK